MGGEDKYVKMYDQLIMQGRGREEAMRLVKMQQDLDFQSAIQAQRRSREEAMQRDMMNARGRGNIDPLQREYDSLSGYIDSVGAMDAPEDALMRQFDLRQQLGR